MQKSVSLSRKFMMIHKLTRKLPALMLLKKMLESNQLTADKSFKQVLESDKLPKIYKISNFHAYHEAFRKEMELI